MKVNFIPPTYNFVFDAKSKLENRAKKSANYKKYLKENKGIISLVIYFPKTATQPKAKRYKTTGISVLKEQWNKEGARVKPLKGSLYQTINEQLNDFLKKHLDYQKIILNKKGTYSVLELDKIQETTEYYCFIQFYKKELEFRKSNPILKSTVKNLKKTLAILELLYTTLPFTKLDRVFIAQIETHIKDKKYSEWYRWEIHKSIKTILSIAHKEKVYSKDYSPYNDYKVAKPTKIPLFLTYKEFKRIEDFKSEDFRLQRTRDMFVFSFYTALRVVDLLKIEPKHIIEDEDKRVWLDLKANKSKKVDRIPLSYSLEAGKNVAEAVFIANKYIELYKDFDNKKLFQITDVKYNKSLKTLATKCDIGLNLTSHIARKSFGHIAAKHFNINITVIQRIMQHSNVTTTMQYSGYNDDVIYDALNKGFKDK